MKRNIDDFYGMKDFIISIIGAVAWFLIGTIVVIGYFTVKTKGESVMLSFISTIFTIISSLGIAATIGVYFWQKKDSINKAMVTSESVNSSHNKVIYDEGMKIKQSLEQLISIKNTIISSNGKVKIITTNGFQFVKPNNNKELPLQLRNVDSIRELYISSSSCSNQDIYESARFIYEANNQVHNFWLCSLIFCDIKDGVLSSIENKYLEYWKSSDLETTLTAINYAIELIRSDDNLDTTSFFDKSINKNGEVVITIKKSPHTLH